MAELRLLHETGRGLPARGKRPEGRHMFIMPPETARASGTAGLGYKPDENATRDRPRRRVRGRRGRRMRQHPTAPMDGLPLIAFVAPRGEPADRDTDRDADNALAFATAVTTGTRGSTTETNELRASFIALAKAKEIPAGAAERCLEAASLLLNAARGHPDAPLRRAADLLIHAVRASPDLTQKAMRVCVGTPQSGPLASPVARRLRHAIRTMFDEYGNAALAAFAIARKDGPRDPHPTFSEWDALAASKLEAMPLSAEEWLEATFGEMRSACYEETARGPGCAEWTSRSKTGASTPRRLMTWNANSLFKRIRTGNLAEVLRTHDPDVLHVSEIKGSPDDRPETPALRAAMHALGYVHVAWNWCSDAPGNHGSVVFSKCPMSVIFGTDSDGRSDAEGRF